MIPFEHMIQTCILPWHSDRGGKIHDLAKQIDSQYDRLPVTVRDMVSEQKKKEYQHQYARFLPASTSTMTTEFLRLASPRVRDQECPVVGDELLLELHRAVRVHVLRIVRDERLRDRLAESIHLRGVSSTLDAEADVDGGECLFTSNENRLVDLQPEDLRLNERYGGAIEVNEASTLLGVCDRRSSLVE